MKCRMLLMISLSTILIQGLVQAQESNSESSQTGRFRSAEGSASDSVPETKIFALKYYPAEELMNILRSIQERDTSMAIDRISNQLIITGPSAELDRITRVITELDVPKKSVMQSLPIMCRVYMLEPSPKDNGLKSFTLKITDPAFIKASTLEAINSDQLKIESIESPSTEPESIIKGQASSSAMIGQFLPDCIISSLHFEDNKSFVPTSQVAPLPESLRSHIDRFLGKNAQIAGYWFGNLSIPGSVKAPIGPWSFEFGAERLGTEDSIELELSVEEVRGDQAWRIMHNVMQGKIGHPVIIGYNRNKNGVSIMGALVLIPEPMPVLK